jgi:protein phosphatase
MRVVESAGITDVGKKRKGNEDFLFLDDAMGLYVLADGMGGHQAGEVASEMVVDTIRDYMKQFKAGSLDDADDLEDVDESLSQAANRILIGIRRANREVYQAAQTKASYNGMGSTVAAVYFTSETLIVSNVGDSPVYLIHKGDIEPLSVIHNVITEQSAINPDAAQHIAEQYKHLLTRAMGIEETVQPHITEIQHFDGDIVVMSSDGLTDLVSPEEIRDVVNKERHDKACQTLVDMANARGGHDNITVIVLKIKTAKGQKSWSQRLTPRITEGVMVLLKKLFHHRA